MKSAARQRISSGGTVFIQRRRRHAIAGALRFADYYEGLYLHALLMKRRHYWYVAFRVIEYREGEKMFEGQQVVVTSDAGGCRFRNPSVCLQAACQVQCSTRKRKAAMPVTTPEMVVVVGQHLGRKRLSKSWGGSSGSTDQTPPVHPTQTPTQIQKW